MQNKYLYCDTCEKCERRTHKYCQGLGLPYLLNLVQTTCCKRKICTHCISSSFNCPFCNKELKNYPPKELEHEDDNVTVIERARKTVHPSLGTSVPLFSDETNERIYEMCLEKAIEFVKNADGGEDPRDRAREAPHVVRKIVANSGVDGQAEYEAFIKKARDNEMKFLQELCKCMPIYGGVYDEDFTLPTNRRNVSNSSSRNISKKHTGLNAGRRQLSVYNSGRMLSFAGQRAKPTVLKSVMHVGKDGKKVLTVKRSARRLLKPQKKDQ